MSDDFPMIDPELLAEMDIPEPVISDVEKVRMAITDNVGDIPSILGTTADVLQLSTVCLLAFVAALDGDEAGVFTRFKASIEELLHFDSDHATIYTMAQSVVDGVKSGDIKLTAAVKGVDSVFTDFAVRNTGVAQVLIQAAQAAAAAEASE